MLAVTRNPRTCLWCGKRPAIYGSDGCGFCLEAVLADWLYGPREVVPAEPAVKRDEDDGPERKSAA